MKQKTMVYILFTIFLISSLILITSTQNVKGATIGLYSALILSKMNGRNKFK